ncbi:hypothetical protein SY88_04300 [Clostridiales bacterium PH28_bin88]|nr:hypothetical protein SY88_04300 [Clostridiales bacterium PH28_bin88]
MPGLFSTINTAVTALRAQQTGLSTTSHNIANANTPGFTRQEAVMTASLAIPAPGFSKGLGMVGTGVEILTLRRVRDAFIDVQVRQETSSLGQWEVRRDTLQRVEISYMEPSDDGMNALLSQFWNAWQELTKNPESSPVRVTVRETSMALAEALRHSYSQLRTTQNDLSSMVDNSLLDINSLARQISDLNAQIANVYLTGQQPNDLLDQRDLLLDRLAKIVPIQVEAVLQTVGGQEKDTGMVRVSIPGNTETTGDPIYLVDGRKVREVLTRPADGVVVWGQAAYDPRTEAPPTDTDLSDNIAVTATNGSLMGLVLARDNLVQGYMDQLNALARGLMEMVNEVHRAGYDLDGNGGGSDPIAVPGLADPYTGGFFTGTGAADIEVEAAIQRNVKYIRAAGASSANPGDANNALAIIALRQTRLEVVYDANSKPITLQAATGPGGTTFDNYYKDMVSSLGVAAHEAGRMADNQQVLVDQLLNRRDSTSGVSIDEEMTRAIQYQRVYQAAARIITTVDEMLDTIVNQMKR